MAGFMGGIGNLANLTQSNAVQGYMNSIKDSLTQANPQNAVSGNLEGILKGGISQTDVFNDPELFKDLELLTKNNQGLNSPSNSPAPVNTEATADTVAKTFENVMGSYINDVNTKQVEAEDAVKLFSSGGNIDLHNVMIAMEKSSLAMNLTLQMRNKILSAYQEISRMQV